MDLSDPYRPCIVNILRVDLSDSGSSLQPHESMRPLTCTGGTRHVAHLVRGGAIEPRCEPRMRREGGGRILITRRGALGGAARWGRVWSSREGETAVGGRFPTRWNSSERKLVRVPLLRLWVDSHRIQRTQLENLASPVLTLDAQCVALRHARAARGRSGSEAPSLRDVDATIVKLAHLGDGSPVPTALTPYASESLMFTSFYVLLHSRAAPPYGAPSQFSSDCAQSGWI